ncbi:hypothetical protein [uncultured Lacinutrix sp.]|uniref:hypothetical protein n=1 Tax=uncultured Lacinutrix sp. TaxID=574032 RepID=UPI00260DCFD9|nr:hypothetical protein [uncultured Lacinutrix sp.]
MSMLKQLPKQSRIVYLLIYLFAGLYVLRVGPIFYPDSYAFLDMAINRSPVYSVFLKCFTLIFGDAFAFPTLIVQYLLMVFATHFLLSTLYKSLKLHSYTVLFFQLTFLANAIIWYHSVTRILSESLAFPLVIIFVAYLFTAIKYNSFSSLLKAIGVLFLLQFNRGQFIVFIPIVLLIGIYLMYNTKKIKIGVLSIALLILIPIFSSFSERVYNKIVINQYKNYAMTYVHFISAPFFVANSENVSLFKTEEEKDFFRRTFNRLESKRLTLEMSTEDDEAPYVFFERNFTKICNATIHEYNRDFYAAKGLNEYEQQYKVDELTSSMFLPLLKANLKSWVKHVKRSFIKGVGGRIVLLILFFILACSSWLFIKSKDYRFVFLALAIVLKFSNNLIIAMVVHSIGRYTFYFDWIIFAALILLFNPLFKKYSKLN